MQYAPASNLAWVVASDFDPTDDQVYAMLLPNGKPTIINGSGALVFLAVLEGLDPLSAVADIVQLPPEQIAPDVQSFLDELLNCGFLVPASTGRS